MKKRFGKNNGAENADYSAVGNNSVKAILIGLVSFILIIFILSVVLSIVILHSDISSSTINILYISVILVSGLLGGFITGRKCTYKGIVHGFVLGLCISTAISAITAVVGNISIYSLIIKSVIVVLSSTIGGIIGIK